MSQQVNNPFDNDLDAFLNYDQAEQTPMSSSADVKPALLHQSSHFDSNSSTFSGPSYQYDSHRQQTGLPMGGYASTLAVNQASGLHYRPSAYGSVIPTQTLNVPLSNLDEFEFNRPQVYDFNDMDMEQASPADMFFGESSISPATQAPQRIYPGMHTQQANQMKIQQAAQKQQEMIKQQQKQMPAGQQPLPTSTPKSPAVKDPHVEESISRLLNRMRQTSNASGDDADSPSTTSNMPRLKKDEDDMDEDELLLNSEEGKKLSSKERRQLRNKVSARAFRSRRKEYITQLEAEVAEKAQESNELRVQNRQLMEENTRLTDLTRMLLSSQAFSGFLQELSQSGNASNLASAQQPSQQQQQQQQTTQQAQSQPQQQSTRKDIPTHEASRQMQSQQQHMQVGMTLIPETPIDMSIFDNHNSWNNVLPSNDYHVFVVTEMPEPPKLDMEAIRGKTEHFVLKAPVSSKKDLPVLSTLPTPPLSQSSNDVSDDLYTDTDSLLLTTISVPTSLYTTISKASVSSDILSARTSFGSWSDLRQMCSKLDESCKRLSSLMF